MRPDVAVADGEQDGSVGLVVSNWDVSVAERGGGRARDVHLSSELVVRGRVVVVIAVAEAAEVLVKRSEGSPGKAVDGEVALYELVDAPILVGSGVVRNEQRGGANTGLSKLVERCQMLDDVGGGGGDGDGVVVGAEVGAFERVGIVQDGRELDGE